MNDAQLLFDWSNDLQTRQNSFNSSKIEWSEHIKWLQRKISDEKSCFFIFEIDSGPVGVVRLESSEIVIIGVNINPLFRGRGFGSKIIKQACEEFWKTSSDTVFAYIKPENMGSQRSFERAGFIFKEMGAVGDSKCMIYIIKKPK